MTPEPNHDPTHDEVPAGFMAKLMLTAAPFVIAALVYLLIRTFL